MIFRSLDEFDYTLIPANNAPSVGGDDYGDSFPDRALLSTASEDYIGGYTTTATIEGMRCASFEAAGRSIFQKVAAYHASKASRKILAPPTAGFPSWSSTPQARPESVQLGSTVWSPDSSVYLFRQWIPPAFALTRWDCGADSVYFGGWTNHTDTRQIFANNLPQWEGYQAPITTTGRALLEVRSHFSQLAILDDGADSMRHDWENKARFVLKFQVYFKAEPQFFRNPSNAQNFLTTNGWAGIWIAKFSRELEFPQSGLPSPPHEPFVINLDASTQGVSYQSITRVDSEQSGLVDNPPPEPIFQDWTVAGSGVINDAARMQISILSSA